MIVPDNPHHRGTQGFVLAEALASLVVLGLIAVTLAATLRTALAVWHTVATSRRDESIAQRIDRLAAFIQDVPRQAPPGTAAEGARFLGAPTSLHVVTLSQATFMRGGLARVVVRQQPGGRGVVIDHGPARSTVEPFGFTTEPLFDDPRLRVSFRYFGVTEDGRGAEWVSSWPPTAPAPQFIRVVVLSAGGLVLGERTVTFGAWTSATGTVPGPPGEASPR